MKLFLTIVLTGIPFLALAQTRPFLIKKFETEHTTPLRTVLQQLDEDEDFQLETTFASHNLETSLLPQLSLRRVYLQDLLVALGHLSGTQIEMSQTDDEEKIRLLVEAAPSLLVPESHYEKVLNLASNSRPKEINPDERHTQVFPVARFLEKNPQHENSAEILQQLDSLLKHQAELRGESAQQIQEPPFKLELHEATQIILLHAPAAYQVTAKAFFDQFERPNPPQTEKVERPEMSAEVEILVMLQNMRDELSELRKKSQLQEETIRELRQALEQSDS